MKLIFKGQELDANVEHELLAPNKELGFTVEIKFNPFSPFGNKTATYNNVTEVHNLYETALEDKRIAFESDIHSTGCTKNIDNLEYVNITDAVSLGEFF